MTRSTLSVVAGLGALLLGMLVPLSPGNTASLPKAPPAVIIVLDYTVILRESQAALSIVEQVEAFNIGLKRLASDREKELNEARQTLEAERGSISAEQFAERARAIEAEIRDAQIDIQERTRKIQIALQNANVELRKELDPILRGIMQEKGANLLIEKNRVAFNATELDVTDEVLRRFNDAVARIEVVYPPNNP